MMTEATPTNGRSATGRAGRYRETELDLLISVNSRRGVAVVPWPYCAPDRINGYGLPCTCNFSMLRPWSLRQGPDSLRSPRCPATPPTAACHKNVGAGHEAIEAPNTKARSARPPPTVCLIRRMAAAARAARPPTTCPCAVGWKSSDGRRVPCTDCGRSRAAITGFFPCTSFQASVAQERPQSRARNAPAARWLPRHPAWTRSRRSCCPCSGGKPLYQAYSG